MDQSYLFNKTLIREVMDKSCLYVDIVTGEEGTHCTCRVTFRRVRLTTVDMEINKYRYSPHNDLSVNGGPHTRRWSFNMIYDMI